MVMGLISAAAGLAAFFGLSPVENEIELEFFSIVVDTARERLWWILGSLTAAGVGLWLMRPHKDKA